MFTLNINRRQWQWNDAQLTSVMFNLRDVNSPSTGQSLCLERMAYVLSRASPRDAGAHRRIAIGRRRSFRSTVRRRHGGEASAVQLLRKPLRFELPDVSLCESVGAHDTAGHHEVPMICLRAFERHDAPLARLGEWRAEGDVVDAEARSLVVGKVGYLAIALEMRTVLAH